MTNTNVNDWLVQNRWWRREQNIQHVRYMLSLAQQAQQRAFWQLILERLEG